MSHERVRIHRHGSAPLERIREAGVMALARRLVEVREDRLADAVVVGSDGVGGDRVQ